MLGRAILGQVRKQATMTHAWQAPLCAWAFARFGAGADFLDGGDGNDYLEGFGGDDQHERGAGDNQ